MTTDSDLLRSFVEQHSDASFRLLVERHLGLVYGTCVRRLGGDRHLAEDVSQQVFVELSRNARQLLSLDQLAPWLHRVACNLSSNTVRTEQRRKHREQVTLLMDQNTTESSLDWERLKPILDEALAQLSESDRTALLLRYFEGRRLSAIGEHLGVAENTARMRVERALEKLRLLLAKRGMSSVSASLALLLERELGAVGVPTGLATRVCEAAMATTPVLVSYFGLTATHWLRLGAWGGGLGAVGLGLMVLGRDPSSSAPSKPLERAGGIPSEHQTEPQTLSAPSVVKPTGPSVQDLSNISTRSQLQELPGSRKGDSKAGPEPGAYFFLSEVDVKPTPVVMKPPSYPRELLKIGQRGELHVAFVVDRTGAVSDVYVEDSTHEAFTRSAIEAVHAWVFQPGIKAGCAVNTRVVVPIVFEIPKTKNDE